jgi:hypothetical protein
MFLNPSKIEEISKRIQEKHDAKRLKLLDEHNVEAKERQRFDLNKRSVHRDIPPAKDRIDEYKRKCFGRLFTGLAAARDK